MSERYVLPSGKVWSPRYDGRIPKRKSRRTREREAGNGWTKEEFSALCDKYGNVCLACGENKRLVADHVTPLRRGGRHELANIQPLCFACNLRKGLQIIDYRNRHEIIAAGIPQEHCQTHRPPVGVL